MNPSAILALISDLYGQISVANHRIAELESELEGERAGNERAEREANIASAAERGM